MNKKKNVVSIVQARMGSTRLPGKVLMDIIGKPMLWHVVNRLKYSKFIDRIVIATTRNKNDDILELFCKDQEIDFFRGNEEDVLDRYYQAANLYQADVIVRITADCPLIDPFVVDKVITGYLENHEHLDGASNIIKRTYPKGLDTEVVSYATLEKIRKNATRKYEREHVTIFIYEHLELFKLHSVENPNNLSDLRWTVDEEADLRFVREIYRILYQDSKMVFMDDVLKILKKEPQLAQINKNIKHK